MVSRRTGRRWEKRLRGLELPEPFNMDDFIRAVEQWRGRNFVFIDTALLSAADTPCGLWAPSPTKSVDYVWIDKNLTGIQKDVAKGHEIGHAVLGHTPKGVDLAQLVTAFEYIDPVAMDPQMFAGLGRTTYGEPQEREAEDFGTSIALRIQRAAMVTSDPVMAALRASMDTRASAW